MLKAPSSFDWTIDGTLAADIAAQGTLTMDTNPTTGDTMTVGSKTYTFLDDTVGVAAQGTLTMDTNPTADDTITVGAKVYTFKGPIVAGVAAQGTLTMDTNPTADDTMTVDSKTYTFKGPLVSAVAAQGTLTMDTNPTNGDTMTIGAKTYTFQDTLTDVDGNIQIGASLADTQHHVHMAINLTGVGGAEYAASMTEHPTVSAAAFALNDMVLTAKTAGTAGNSLTSTETFTAGTNVFDAATLGTTTAGVDEVTVADADGNVIIGANVAATKASLVAAFDLSGTPGVDYAASMTAHQTVDIAAFVGDDAVLTAKSTGTAGNSIATTETFTAGTNVFDAATLGTTTAGVDAVTVADVDGNITIGADVATTQASLVAAFDLSGTGDGSDYGSNMTAHPTVDIAAFAGNDAVLTAKTAGTAGNSIATTETFTAGTNVFDAATLGTTTAGVDAAGIADADGNILIGADVAATQANLVAAFDLSGTGDGSDYAASMTAHPTVDIAAFAGNDAVLTAKTGGTAGNALATTETFTAGTNVFDAATLGTTTAGVDASRIKFVAPMAGRLSAIYGAVGTAPTGANLLVDVNKGGTTIFTSQANRFTVEAGDTEGMSAGINVTDFEAGDVFDIYVDQIGSSVAGADLTMNFSIVADPTPTY